MELINDTEDDLQNKTIKINEDRSTKSASIGSQTQNESNAVQNFLTGFKNFIKPKITSSDIEKDNIESNTESNSDQITNASFSEKKEESCKDKLANKIIESVEVERNVGVFVALVTIGSLILCLASFYYRLF